MNKKQNGILFPPEASLNWLLQDFYLLNILNRYDFAIIDIEDYNRYHRLAKESNTLFVKAFLLKLLKTSGFLWVIDYTTFYNVKDCAKTFLQSKTITDTLYKYDNTQDLIYEYASYSYEGYISYARSDLRESIYKLVDTDNIKSFKNSQEKAVNQFNQIKNKKFSNDLLNSYWNRLFTRILSSYHIVKTLNHSYKNLYVSVFDSLEYLPVQQVIKKINYHDYHDLTNYSKIHDINSFQKIDERIYRIVENEKITDDKFPVIIPLLIAYIVGQKEINKTLTQQVSDLNYHEIKNEVNDLYKKYLFNNNKVNEGKGVITTILGLINGNFSYLFAADILLNLIYTVKKIENSDKSELAKLLTLAVIFNEPFANLKTPKFKFDYKYWLTYFISIFKKRTKFDISWYESQRNMGDWTKTEIYLPWYEDFHSLRYRQKKNSPFIIF